MNEQAKIKLTRARIALITEHPFYGALALRLALIENNSIPALAVNGKEIFYNADFILSLDDDLVKAAVAHEVGHCVFEHINRRGDRNPAKWNHAGDYVINQILSDSGFKIGPGWLLDATFKDMSADHIYSMLPDPPPSPGGGGLPGPGQPNGPLCDIQDADVHDDVSSVDEWKIATVQAATAAKQAGKLPGTLERFIHEMLNPKADWRTVLRRFITEKNKNNYSWQRPKKMMIPHGMYLPTLYSKGMGHVVIAIDTSGSITQHMLDVFSSEVQAVRDATQPRLTTVIYCDSRINHVDEFIKEDVLTLKMHGGGGTDFRPPFAYVEKHGLRPAAFLYLTDLYGPAPTTPPEYPVLWCKTTSENAPWGETVEIEV